MLIKIFVCLLIVNAHVALLFFFCFFCFDPQIQLDFLYSMKKTKFEMNWKLYNFLCNIQFTEFSF